jgi:tetratricopeptide (TPR) repeat protein
MVRGDWYAGRVKLRASVALLCLALTGALPACKVTKGPSTIDAGATIDVANLDDFEQALNRYALLEDPQARRNQRAALQEFLGGYVASQITDGDPDEAVQALRYGVGLYTPAELRDESITSPELATLARKVYKLTARRGAETPSLLALAVGQRFGDDAGRKRAVEQWQTLEEWVVRNGPFAQEPLLRHEELERSLEDVAAAFPSPFVVQRLADLYRARYDAAKASRGQDASSTARRRIEVTGYLLMRVYLRADDIDGARKALASVELDLPVAKLAELMDDAFKPRRSPQTLLAFAEQFTPDASADADDPYTVQGWAIVDNLSRRAVASHPKDAYVHLLRARTLRHAGLGGAAIEHLRRCLAIKEDVFGAWQELAQLEQRDLERAAARDPVTAADRLPRLEKMHARATKLWSDRPIRPGMPEAFYTVAQGLYEVGDARRAEVLLRKSVGIEPVPNSLDLLGTIALKQSKLVEAKSRYEDLANLAYDNELTQLQWEARARQQLGEIALRRGDKADSMRHIRMALRHTNDLLARPSDDVGDRAARLVERGKLLFYLGDTALAMSDFARAAELAPDDVKVYADPLIAVVSHGYYEEARTIFRRAMGRKSLAPSLKLYFSLWIGELARRQGHPAEAEAETFIDTFKGQGWSQKLASHARGEISFDGLMDSAQDRGQRAEALFYEALRRWDAGDGDAAKVMLRKVIETGMMGFFEYDMAQAYLDWNELPKVARAPLTAG